MSSAEMLLRTGQLAKRWHVSPKQVTRYAREQGLPFKWTPGGHRRYDPVEADAWWTQRLLQADEMRAAVGARYHKPEPDGAGRVAP